MINFRSKFGRRAERRLKKEAVIWLSTVGPGPRPEPRPVWFLWDGKTFLIYSQPDAWKLKHIARFANVALNLNSDEVGEDVVVLVGKANVDRDAPPAHKTPAYLRKYRESIRGLGMTPESFAAEYSVAVRVRPVKLRGF